MTSYSEELALADARAENEHQLYVQECESHKESLKQIIELEKLIRDARLWIREHKDSTPIELSKIISRSGVVTNGYMLADRSKAE